MPRYSPRKRFPDRRSYTYNTQAIRDPESPATEKQIAFLRSLAQDRDCQMPAEDASLMIDLWIETGTLTKGFISTKIEEFKTLPRRAMKSAEPGYYTHDGNVWVVVKTKDGERTYAKQLVDMGNKEKAHWSWEYAPGAGRILADMKPLTIEEAAAFGHLHGQCMICLRPLTQPESVKAGIGPVCAKKVTR